MDVLVLVLACLSFVGGAVALFYALHWASEVTVDKHLRAIDRLLRERDAREDLDRSGRG